jgi:hypothetical protein
MHLQPSFPALLTATGIIGDSIDTGGIVLALVLLTFIDVSGTVVTLKACTAIADI